MNTTAATDMPAWGRIQQVTRSRGLNRTRIYELIAAGSITAVKDGRALMIDISSVDRYLASLPKAEIRLPKTMARRAADSATLSPSN